MGNRQKGKKPRIHWVMLGLVTIVGMGSQALSLYMQKTAPASTATSDFGSAKLREKKPMDRDMCLKIARMETGAYEGPNAKYFDYIHENCPK